VPFKHLVATHTNNDAFPVPAVARVLEIVRQVFGDVLLRTAGS
jgi:hypothetical protein